MSTIKSKPLRGYKNIIRLGEHHENQTHSLYKYMNVQRAIEFLESGDYYFVEPMSWTDPYEKRFYTADYSSVNFAPRQCFCTCLTDSISSEAAWKMYRNSNGGLADRTIRFEFNRKILFSVWQCQLWLHDKRDKWTGPSNSNYDKYFVNIDEEKFLHLLLIKRKAFKYESEIRLFILPEHREEIYLDEDLKVFQSLKLQFSKEQLESMIESISIDPSCSDIECDMIKTKIQTLFPNIKCTKNGLYSKKPRLIIK